MRYYEDETLLVLNNFTASEQSAEWPESLKGLEVEKLIGNYAAEMEGAADGIIRLRPWEAVVYRFKK